jgi:predicted Zn-dependent protease
MKTPSPSPVLRRAAAFLVLTLAVAWAWSCATNPVTGKQQLALMSEAQEIELGRQADRDVVASIGLYPEERLQQYVQGLGTRLAAGSERPHLPWTFRVVDDASVNAFALPGGFIYLTRGILTHLNSEAELVSVMGHEMGHVTARHSVSQMSKQQLAGLGLGLAMIFAPQARPYGDLAQTGLGLMFLKFSRQDERQADDLGLKYLVQAGYDPRPMTEVFALLERVSQTSSGGRLPQWLASHPDPEARRETIGGEIAQLAQDWSGRPVARDAYLQRIDGVVFGPDPREGFFEGETFYHPGLAFQIRFPDGWKLSNQKQVVAAISPRQDAIVALSLTNASSPREAARAFFSQQGVEQGQRWRDRIGGMAADSYAFSASTQQGQLSGLAAWVEHRGKIYQLLGYTLADRAGSYRDAITTSLASFDRVLDRAILEVQPRRVDVVKLQRGESLEGFVREYPSTVPAQTVALVNNLDSGSSLRAGELYKRITGGPGRGAP